MSRTMNSKEALVWIHDRIYNSLPTDGSFGDPEFLFMLLKMIEDVTTSVLDVPERECDLYESDLEADELHKSFIEYCNSCDCPMGCILRKEAGDLLDNRCSSIMKCFARFVLSKRAKHWSPKGDCALSQEAREHLEKLKNTEDEFGRYVNSVEAKVS